MAENDYAEQVSKRILAEGKVHPAAQTVAKLLASEAVGLSSRRLTQGQLKALAAQLLQENGADGAAPEDPTA